MRKIGNNLNALGGVSLALLALFVTSSLIFPRALEAQGGPQKTPGLSDEARSHARKAVTAVGLVLVRRLTDSSGERPRPRGSAVVIRKDGLVATNYHVIIEDRAIRPYDEIYFSLPSGSGEAPQHSGLYRLEPLLIDKRYDLALLRVVKDPASKSPDGPFDFPVLEIGDSRGVKLLDDLIIIGFPEKGGPSVTVNTGIVEGTDVLENWIKTDARLIHGNSGGAAVDSEGKLIGIPTKVVADRQPVDKNGDGFPDEFRFYGAVGFLRPAHLLLAMLEQLETRGMEAPSGSSPRPVQGVVSVQKQPVLIRGIIKSETDGKPVAGARVGLTPAGSTEVSVENLLSWGGSNGEGAFSLNRPVPAGNYTLVVRAIKYEAYTRELYIDGNAQLVIQLRPSP
ncbi:MAG TPA: trypsin-like peptidase domain-containing protein [Blastocatellia bacterium]|nr:trypsin-like peptidase domain-containing protein [Blastocatellia bacterium]